MHMRHVRRTLAAVTGAATVLGLVITGSPAGAVAPVIYVGPGPTCSDAGTGASALPYCTLSKAATVAVSGQTVEVAAGSYAGGATVGHSGAAGAPIVFHPASGAAVTVQGGMNAFRVNGKSYITIEGFTITGTTSYGIAALTSTNITIDSNTVTHSGTAGAPTTVAYGIYLQTVSDSVVSNNQVDSNSNSGIFLGNGTTRVTVRGNEASLNASYSSTSTLVARQATGIDVIGPNNTVIDNIVHDNEDSGIQVYPVSDTKGVITRGGDNTLVANNVSYNNGDHGIDNRDVNGGRLISNTVYHNCTTGINIEGTSLNYLVENNISVDNAIYPAYQGLSCARRAGNIGVWDASTATLDYNLVHTASGALYYYKEVQYTSISTLRTATGQEAHGLQADPRFVDSATYDLRLAAGSPAIDSADSAASGEQSTDLLGQPRVDDPATNPNTGNGPRSYDDRGAYEFQPTVAPAPGGSLHSVTPTRILDTRNGTGTTAGAVPAGGSVVLQVTGRGGVPTNDVIAAVMNVTVTGPQGAGFVTVFPTGSAAPSSSNLNFGPGQTVPNLVTVAVNPSGQVTLRNGSPGSVQLIADVSGWFGTPATSAGPSGRYNPTVPFRLIDTRSTTALGQGATRTVQVTGRSGSGGSIPATGVAAVVLNITVTTPTASGYLTVYPTSGTKPNVSTLNFTPGITRANRAIVGLGSGGTVSVFNSAGTSQVLVDVSGWFTDATAGGTGSTFVPLSTPQRLLDSRGGSAWTADTARAVPVAGNAGVPSLGAAVPPKGVLANVTATGGSGSSYLSVYPGSARPVASDLNWSAGQTVPNLTVAGLSNDGSVTIYNHIGRVDVIVDIFGWFA